MYEVTGDDQLPLLILVVVVDDVDKVQITESGLTNIIAQMRFITNFDFMHCRNNELEYYPLPLLTPSYCYASFATAIDFLKQFKVRHTQPATLAPFHLSRPSSRRSNPDFGLKGWTQGDQSIFNDILTQSSLEQLSRELGARRPSAASISTPRSVVTHVVKKTEPQYWWSDELEMRLQWACGVGVTRRRVERSTFDLSLSQSTSASLQNSLSHDNTLGEFSPSELSDSSLGDMTGLAEPASATDAIDLSRSAGTAGTAGDAGTAGTAGAAGQEARHLRWLGCCCDEKCVEMKMPGDVSYIPLPQPAPEKEETVIHFDQPLLQHPVTGPQQSVENNVMPIQKQTSPVASSVSTETEQRESSMSSASSTTFYGDNGMGPFLSSLKMNRRKVLRSSDYVSC